MKTHIFLICLITPLLSSFLPATGPSYIYSEIRPVSINEKGEILCRTHYVENKMGARRKMTHYYGYCVISADSIIEYETQELKGDGFPDNDVFYKQKDYWDSIFRSCFHAEGLSTIGYVLKEKHNFSSCNVNSCEQNLQMSIAELEEKKEINIKRTPQKALGGAYSTEYTEDQPLKVLYDFGHVLIIENLQDASEELYYGAKFSYPLFWTNEEGEKIDIGYDFSKVTGVLIFGVNKLNTL